MQTYEEKRHIDGWNVSISVPLPPPEPLEASPGKYAGFSLVTDVSTDHNFKLGTYIGEDGNIVNWQEDDINELVEKDASANWSDMGCFKTTTLEWLIEKKLSHIVNPKVLVITTKTGKGTYYQTLPYLLPKWEIISANGKDLRTVYMDKELPLPVDIVARTSPMIVLSHYNVFSLRKMRAQPDDDAQMRRILHKTGGWPSEQAKLLTGIEWDMIVLDEAHRIKNYQGRGSKHATSWAKVIIEGFRKVPYKHIMTGTGFINRPDEIWALFHFLGYEQPYWAFRSTFVDEWVLENGYRQILGVRPHMVKRFRKLRTSYGPRRMKTEVFKDLKVPIETDIPVDLNPTQRKMYDEIRDYLRTLDQAGEPIQSPNVLSQLNRLRQIAVATPEIVADYYDAKLERRVQKVRLREPSSKLDAVMEILEGLEWDDEEKNQVVIFSAFKDPLRLLETRFKRAGIPYLHLKVEDNDHDRYKMWAVEFPKKEHQVFMSTLQLGSESISLTPAQTVIFLDLAWSPKDNIQARDRVWRPGQKGVPHVIRVVARNTTDRRMIATHNTKVGWFEMIFGPDEDEGDSRSSDD